MVMRISRPSWRTRMAIAYVYLADRTGCRVPGRHAMGHQRATPWWAFTYQSNRSTGFSLP